MPEWTQERIDQLAKLWNVDKLSASKCAEVLGVTKNAIIGKVQRLKLDRRAPSPKKVTDWKQEAAERKARLEAKKLQERVRKEKAVHARPKPVPQPEFAVDLTALKATDAWAPLPGSSPIHLVDTRDSTCRWPIGDSSPYMFCGCQTVEGSSYCLTHKTRATGKGTPSERDAHLINKRKKPMASGVFA